VGLVRKTYRHDNQRERDPDPDHVYDPNHEFSHFSSLCWARGIAPG
jgi:hypothetical protein